MMTWKQATMGFHAMTKVCRTFHQKKDLEVSTAAQPSMGGTCEEYKRRSNGQLDTLALSCPEAFTCGITYPAVGDKS